MSIFTTLRGHKVVVILIALVAIIIAIIAGRSFNSKAAPAIDNSTGKQVILVNAGNFVQGGNAVSASGIVESRSQAELRSLSSAPISSINVSIGQMVYSGQVIMELQNADIRAQLMQADASLALAKGQYSTGDVSLSSAKQAAIDKIRDAYIKTYDAVVTQTEPILYNNDGGGGQLTANSSDTVLNNEIIDAVIYLRSAFRDWKTMSESLANSTSTLKIQAAIDISQTNMARAELLLNDVSKVLNNLATNATPPYMTSISTWKSIVGGAQTSLSAAQSALTGAEASLNTSNSSQGSSGNAQIAIAQAGVNNLQAQLEKTIIRTPITGRIAALPLRQGELASPGTLLATVIGDESGLLIKAFVSGEDLIKVTIGEPVTVIGRTYENTKEPVVGVVSNISPGVDTTTKKAEVVIQISNSAASGLVIGNNVSVTIAPKNKPVVSAASKQTVIYLLPIQNVKIIPGAAYVFTVDGDSKIKRNDVTLGQIQGDFVQVTGGLTNDMDIVSPVYELDEGDKVRVQ